MARYFLNLTDENGNLIDRWEIESDIDKIDAGVLPGDPNIDDIDFKDGFGKTVEDAINTHERR